jgi:hypothetical protein
MGADDITLQYLTGCASLFAVIFSPDQDPPPTDFGGRSPTPLDGIEYLSLEHQRPIDLFDR